MSESYYLRVRGEVKGPASFPQIVALVRKKRLGRHHEISEDGRYWIRVGDMPELAEYWVADVNIKSRSSQSAAGSPEMGKPENQTESEEWFYANGRTRLGPVSESQLQLLLQSKAISGETLVWCDSLEDWVPARSLPQFSFVLNETPLKKEVSNLQIDQKKEYCTNCGATVPQKAVVCIKCGVPPRSEKEFCYSCGVAVNHNQVICVQCGVGLTHSEQPRSAPFANARNKTTSGILALVLGGLGAHKFYHGSWGWGIVYLLSVLTFIPAIVAFVEGIVLLTMDQGKYDVTYNISPPSAFKW